MNLTELKKMPAPALLEQAQEMGVEGVARARKQDVIFAMLKAHAKRGEDIYGDGVLEILQDGFGFLRSADSSIWRDLTTFTSLRAKFDGSTCEPAIRLQGRFAHRRGRTLLRAVEGRPDQLGFA